MDLSLPAQSILRHIASHPHLTLLDLINSVDTKISATERQAIVLHLVSLGLVSSDGSLPGDLNSHLRLTPSGVELLLHLDEITPLKRLVAAAEAQADQAEENAKSARKDALFSKFVSVIAVIVSIAGILVEALLRR